MANVPLHFSATVIDGLGTKGTAIAYLAPADTTTLATLATDLATWATDLDAVTDGIITAARMEITPAVPGGLKSDTTTDAFKASRLEQTATFNMRTAQTPRRFGTTVPAFADAAIVAGKVDLTHAGVAALITLLGGGIYTNAVTQVLTGLVDAVLSFRSSRRQLGRSSFEVA